MILRPVANNGAVAVGRVFSFAAVLYSKDVLILIGWLLISNLLISNSSLVGLIFVEIILLISSKRLRASSSAFSASLISASFFFSSSSRSSTTSSSRSAKSSSSRVTEDALEMSTFLEVLGTSVLSRTDAPRPSSSKSVSVASPPSLSASSKAFSSAISIHLSFNGFMIAVNSPLTRSIFSSMSSSSFLANSSLPDTTSLNLAISWISTASPAFTSLPDVIFGVTTLDSCFSSTTSFSGVASAVTVVTSGVSVVAPSSAPNNSSRLIFSV